MTLLRLLVLLVVLAVSPLAIAENWQWSTAVTLSHVYPLDDGLIFMPQGFTNPSSTCPTYFHLAETDPNYETKVAGLLMAFATGKSITFVYDAAATGCGSPVDRFIVSN